jgi:CTP:molybdopterin cytidylyltransferase MocA
VSTVTVLIFHRPANAGDPPLVRTLDEVREHLVSSQIDLFANAGVDEVTVVDEWHEGKTFGEVLAALAPKRGGAIVLSGGAVPLLDKKDARKLVDTAASRKRIALTNNRYSSDVVAVADALTLADLPPLPSDNALPRWLEERAAYEVDELGSRKRLGLDLDTPQDVALVALHAKAPSWLRDAAEESRLSIPRLDELRQLAADPLGELLVFGRSSSQALRWLERNVRCRVRFLAEERGMRASSPLAIAGGDEQKQPRPRSTFGYEIEREGPAALTDIVRALADGAIVDSRVLLAQRWGIDEAKWPSANDRFASDLHRPREIEDEWLKRLTEATAASDLPILLGGHSLVGPGISLVLQATVGPGGNAESRPLRGSG